MKARFTGPVLCVLRSCGFIAQSAPPPLSFEVDSITSSASDERGMFLQLQPGGGPSPGSDARHRRSRVANTIIAVQQQLGLRLESQKGLVGLIVVDHVEKPSEN